MDKRLPKTSPSANICRAGMEWWDGGGSKLCLPTRRQVSGFCKQSVYIGMKPRGDEMKHICKTEFHWQAMMSLKQFFVAIPYLDIYCIEGKM